MDTARAYLTNKRSSDAPGEMTMLSPIKKLHPAGAENATFATLSPLKKISKYSGSSHPQMVSYRQSFAAILFFGSPRFFKTSPFEEPRCNACQFPNPSAGLNHLLSACFSSLAFLGGGPPPPRA